MAAYIVVVGHGPELRREGGAAHVLSELGATVKALDLWDDPATVLPQQGDCIRVVLIEALGRPDIAETALRALRRETSLAGCGFIVAVSASQVAQLDPSTGFDDLVLVPYVPAELYARIRKLEWCRSEFANDERIKIGDIVIDRHGHDVQVSGKRVALTARELSLLLYLCDRRGRVVSRQEALARVWGDGYEGGPRTVDIHVRRLRSKLGDALPLRTLRGAGYKIAAPNELSERDPGATTGPRARP